MISIIIPNYNGEKFLFDCIQSIYSQKYSDYEIILVDNNSVDGSLTLVRDTFPLVKIVTNSTNRGFSGGCNDGAEIASGEFLLFLNTDTILPPDYLKVLSDTTQIYPDYGMYASKMVYPDGRINSTGICISLSGAAWDRGMGESDHGQYDLPEEILGPCGGAALFRKKVFFEVGGFDEDFFLYMEDVDLILRMQQAGWKCWYVPEAIVYHYHGGTAGIQTDVAIYYGNRNILLYPIKDFPIWLLVLAFPWIIGRTIGVIGYYALMGKGKVALKAKCDGIWFLPAMIKKRRYRSTTGSSSYIRKYMHMFAFGV